ncbi:hypothetical protein LIER_31807 [Lithospermum erythrorhizon]|uniref:Uncharacterized protein n=1 Tax=Lithospermum erythrorhizon TaxID=34254 RepID=A0AAV3RVP1_LITER
MESNSKQSPCQKSVETRKPSEPAIYKDDTNQYQWWRMINPEEYNSAYTIVWKRSCGGQHDVVACRGVAEPQRLRHVCGGEIRVVAPWRLSLPPFCCGVEDSHGEPLVF